MVNIFSLMYILNVKFNCYFINFLTDFETGGYLMGFLKFGILLIFVNEIFKI